ncbi:hypothetical protein EMCRGX_G023114 [Ephydatia muelleri]
MRDKKRCAGCMEGTTQGDPLAMAMYAIATVSLIEKLQSTNTKQVWYANDATAGIGITSEGKCHLGAALGSRFFLESYISDKVKVWTSTILNLSLIAKTQPHAAYCAFFHGVSGLWTFFLCTIPDISSLLQPLEDAIRLNFIPSVTGRDSISDIERDLFALPACLGGLALPNPTASASFEYTSSATVHSLRQQLHSSELVRLKAILPPANVRSMDLNSEKGASSWLSVLPISDHGFPLHKGAFHDAMCLRHNLQPPKLPSHCVCGSSNTDHALTCPIGGFPSVRHNALRDFTANLLTEVCPNVYRTTIASFNWRTAVT